MNDASFARNSDLSLKLGFIILLTNDNNICQSIHRSSQKAKRVKRYVLGSEHKAFGGASDIALLMEKYIENMTPTKVRLEMFTDSL